MHAVGAESATLGAAGCGVTELQVRATRCPHLLGSLGSPLFACIHACLRSVEDAEDSVPLPSTSEAVAAVALLRRYCSAIEGSGLVLVDCLDTVEQAVTSNALCSKKQATLTQFFRPNKLMFSSEKVPYQ